MLSAYRRIFDAPGSPAFSAAGFVARMPMSMVGIGIVTMLSTLRGEYRLAGAVAATMNLSAAVLAPRISRLVDERGQRRVILPVTGVAVIATSVLLLCARFGAPDWSLFVAAALAGCIPSTGSLVRARWALLYRGSPLLHTAYAFESVVDEIVFIIGPILSVGLCTTVFPEAGPLLATVLLGVGVLLFAAQRRTEPPPHPRVGGARATSALRTPGLWVPALTFVGVGAIFGSVDVATVAFAGQLHHKAYASVVLAVYASGSCVAGLVFGTLRLRGPLARRFLVGIMAMAASTVPLLFVTNLVVLAAALFVAGLSISPTIVTSLGLIERIVPASKLTEGMTWATTGLTIGVAFGASACGWVVDGMGAAAGYDVTAVAGGLAAATAVLGIRRLHRHAEPAQASPPSGGDAAPADAGAHV